MLSFNSKSYNYLIYICIVFGFILLIFSYMYWILPMDMMAKMGNYIQLVTLFILVFTSIMTVMNFKHQLDDRRRAISIQYANINQSEINDIEKMFMNNPLLDRLYYEMYSHVPHVQKIYRMKHQLVETPELLKAEHHMSSMIFQKIADIYFCEQLDHANYQDGEEWVNTFKCWLRSPILLSHWKYLQHEHHPDVRQFVNNVLISVAPSSIPTVLSTPIA